MAEARRAGRRFRVSPLLPAVALLLAASAIAPAQTTAAAQPGPDRVPLAIVPYNPGSADSAASVAGSLEVAAGKAMIQTAGSVTAGEHAVTLQLTRRGELRLCQTTQLSLTAPMNSEADHSGVMMSLSRGALEARYQTGHNADVILTPDFRIVMSGPGVASVDVRLGEHGDTCVDNHGDHPATVVVSSLFEGGAYAVAAGQRVLFEHGSLREVVDNERESCGCPPEMKPDSKPDINSVTNSGTNTGTTANAANPFPEAVSAGLAPLGTPPPNATVTGQQHAELSATLARKAAANTTQSPAANPGAAPTAATKRSPMARFGRWLKHLFGG